MEIPNLVGRALHKQADRALTDFQDFPAVPMGRMLYKAKPTVLISQILLNNSRGVLVVN